MNQNQVTVYPAAIKVGIDPGSPKVVTPLSDSDLLEAAAQAIEDGPDAGEAAVAFLEARGREDLADFISDALTIPGVCVLLSFLGRLGVRRVLLK